MKSFAWVVLGLVLFVLLLTIFPYFTYASFTTLVAADDFGFKEWASALWLMLAFGATAHATR